VAVGQGRARSLCRGSLRIKSERGKRPPRAARRACADAARGQELHPLREGAAPPDNIRFEKRSVGDMTRTPRVRDRVPGHSNTHRRAAAVEAGRIGGAERFGPTCPGAHTHWSPLGGETCRAGPTTVRLEAGRHRMLLLCDKVRFRTLQKIDADRLCAHNELCAFWAVWRPESA
jgi:hypothetical protein